MNKAVALLRLVHIHPLLWITAALAGLTAHFLELCILAGIIFIHEMGHASVASFYSWRIKRISLLPFGGVAEFDEHGNRPLKEEAAVIIAGPIQHAWMMGAAFLLRELFVLPEDIFLLFIDINMMILLFNLLPIWPLDGGKLLFLALSLHKPFPIAHTWTMIVSFAAISLFSLTVLLLAPTHLNVWFIAGFLYFSLYYEWKQRRYVLIRFLLERHYGKKTDYRKLKPIKVSEEELLIAVLKRFQRGCKHSIIIESSNRESITLDENEVLYACFAEKKLTGKVSDLLFSY